MPDVRRCLPERLFGSQCCRMALEDMKPHDLSFKYAAWGGLDETQFKRKIRDSLFGRPEREDNVEGRWLEVRCPDCIESLERRLWRTYNRAAVVLDSPSQLLGRKKTAPGEGFENLVLAVHEQVHCDAHGCPQR